MRRFCSPGGLGVEWTLLLGEGGLGLEEGLFGGGGARRGDWWWWRRVRMEAVEGVKVVGSSSASGGSESEEESDTSSMRGLDMLVGGIVVGRWR